MGFPQDMGSDECNGSSDVRRYLDQKRREHDFEDMLVRMDNGKTVCKYWWFLLSMVFQSRHHPRCMNEGHWIVINGSYFQLLC